MNEQHNTPNSENQPEMLVTQKYSLLRKDRKDVSVPSSHPTVSDSVIYNDYVLNGINIFLAFLVFMIGNTK